MNTLKKIRTYTIMVFTFFLFLISSCGSKQFQKVKMDDFIGTWVLHGRSMFDGITIHIDKNKNGELKGQLVSLNDNKFVKMFAEPSDVWVSGISRNSNYEFELTEKKIGGALFSVYGLDTSKDFKVQFIDENTIGLSAGSSDPKTSSVRYVRVN